MRLVASIRTVLQRPLSFRGRALRSEFWSLPLCLGGAVAALVGLQLAAVELSYACSGADFVSRGGAACFTLLAAACSALRAALLLWGALAFVSAMVRRLHDVGLSGWLCLPFAPLLFLPGFVVAALPSQTGPNAWGPQPVPVAASSAPRRRRFPWAGAAGLLLFAWAGLTAGAFALDRHERRAVFAAFDELSRHEAVDLRGASSVSVQSLSGGFDLIVPAGAQAAPWRSSLDSWGAGVGLVCLREARGTERVVAGFALVVPERAAGRAVHLCEQWLGIPLADPTDAGEAGLLADADRSDGRRAMVFFQSSDPAFADPIRHVRFSVILHSPDETIAALIRAGSLSPAWFARVRDPAVRGRAALQAALAAPGAAADLEPFFPKDDDATLLAFLREDLLVSIRLSSDVRRTDRLLGLVLWRCSDAATPALAEMLRDRPDLPAGTVGALLDRMARSDSDVAFGAARRHFLATLDADREAADPDASRTLAAWNRYGDLLRDDDFLRDVLLNRLSWSEPPEAGTPSSDAKALRAMARRRGLSDRVAAALLPAFSDEGARRAVLDEMSRFGRLPPSFDR